VLLIAGIGIVVANVFILAFVTCVSRVGAITNEVAWTIHAFSDVANSGALPAFVDVFVAFFADPSWFTKASVSDCDFAPAVGVLPLVIDAIGKSIVIVALPVAARAFGIARLKLADVAFESLGTGAIKLRRAHGGFAGAAVETGLRIAFVRDGSIHCLIAALGGTSCVCWNVTVFADVGLWTLAVIIAGANVRAISSVLTRCW